jgi:hypothetical protein
MLIGCWGGPNVSPLEIVTIELSSGASFGTVGAPSGTFPQITAVSQTGLSIFFSQYENSSSIPEDVLEAYLTDPALMAIQDAMISDLVARGRNGEAPLTPEAYYEMALSHTNDPGTALILCHNVLKAMARGRSPIPWEKVSEERLVYVFNGEQIDASRDAFEPRGGRRRVARPAFAVLPVLLTDGPRPVRRGRLVSLLSRGGRRLLRGDRPGRRRHAGSRPGVYQRRRAGRG